MAISKDPQVESKQLEIKQLVLKADLVNESSLSPSLLSIDASTIGATVVEIDVKEPVSDCHKVQIVDRTSGQSVALSGAPSISNTVVDGKIVSSSISVTLDATGLEDVCIEVIFKS